LVRLNFRTNHVDKSHFYLHGIYEFSYETKTEMAREQIGGANGGKFEFSSPFGFLYEKVAVRTHPNIPNKVLLQG
jgi:hypothetical protein